MDPQKNDNTSPATPTDGGNATNNEINVDLSTLQSQIPATPDPNAAPTDPQTSMAVGTPAVESTVTPADPAPGADSTVSFTTDSNGTVQAVQSPDGISTPPLGSEGASVPAGQQPGSSVSPDAPQPAAGDFSAPSTEQTPASPSFDQASLGGVQPAPTDPNDPLAVPATAPVPTAQKDKKMLVILMVVAVVLLVAIAAMFVL
ncbi:MAG TPA: hypothetical protein VD735_05780 [Candidatus Saccharimonadales bacterium]|nr:hypothetical protein [Candidatus Saccharimonadales bacterium]